MVESASSRESTAYDGIEDPASFPDRESIVRYRSALTGRTAPQADFLVEHLPSGRAIEIGCGNGRMLIELARRQGRQGLGIDIAASRIAFARQWATDESHESCAFEVADALTYPLPSGSFGAAICITGAFAYFEPIAPGSGALLATRLNDALARGGVLCLELYPHPEYLRLLAVADAEVRIWNELPSDDPWRFYLSRFWLDESGETLHHDKTFIHRTTGEVDAGRQERLHIYSEVGITELLERAGFQNVALHEGWADEPYRGGEVMVVTALKSRVG